MAKKDTLYIIALNLVLDRHADIIKWIKEQAKKEDRSLSSFCINALREYKKIKEEKDG